MSDLPPATNYRVTAFVDLDGNGLWSNGEPQTVFVGNPLNLTANQTGVDLEEALRRNLEKKTQRDATRHQQNEKLKGQ